MIKCKQLLAVTHATETGTFANGAYVTDPIRFVSILCAQSSFHAVSGDKGDDYTKLGVTYSVRDRHGDPISQATEWKVQEEARIHSTVRTTDRLQG